nr:uncharacterized protein LOC112019452 [Quercus suber]
MQIKDKGALTFPRKLKSDPSKRSREKYCRFHQDHGHDTANCYDLKQQIEALIRQGNLQKFINKERADPNHQEQASRRDNERPRPPIGDIRMIVGGTATTGSSKKARKTYLRMVQNIQLTGFAPNTARKENPIIGFSEEDARRLHHPHDDALVVSVRVGDYNVHRVLIDNGSSANILYYPAFQQIGIDKARLIPTSALLVGFGGTKVFPIGSITLSVMVGDYPQELTRDVTFLVVNCSSAYNEMEDHHQTMCIEEQQTVAEPVEELKEIILDESKPERTTRIGILASQPARQALAAFLKRNQDVFAWTHKDMPKIDPSVMVHKLNVNPASLPVRQKKRVFAQERDRAIAEEVRKLLEADFIREIGRNVQVYVNDMLVKSLRENDHLSNLQETFDTLRSYNMKLNPSKCVFRVTAGKFLGFMVSQRRIEVNPKKIRAIIKLEPPRTIKDVQSLNGKVAALNRFVSKATDECQKAFEDLKKYLTSPPLLSPAKPGEELYLYLAVSQVVVSAALVREEEGTQQLVYFISKGFQGVEERYPQMEKLAFALVTTARKLKPYFQAHTIIVLTDQPLKRAMSSPEATGRMALWVIELSEFDIHYRQQTVIKGQAVADFIAEYTQTKDKGVHALRQWNIHTEGSSNKQAGGVGVLI